MVDRRIRRDSPRPGGEVFLRMEQRACPVDSPKGFHCQVFGYSSIANNAHNPAVNTSLELPEQTLESFEVACAKRSRSSILGLYAFLLVVGVICFIFSFIASLPPVTNTPKAISLPKHQRNRR